MKNNGTLEKQNDTDKADKKNKTGFNTVHNIPFNTLDLERGVDILIFWIADRWSFFFRFHIHAENIWINRYNAPGIKQGMKGKESSFILFFFFLLSKKSRIETIAEESKAERKKKKKLI